MLYRRHRVSSKALSRSTFLNSTSQSPRPNAQHTSRPARSMQVKGHQDRSISKDDYEEYRAIYNGYFPSQEAMSASFGISSTPMITPKSLSCPPFAPTQRQARAGNHSFIKQEKQHVTEAWGGSSSHSQSVDTQTCGWFQNKVLIVSTCLLPLAQ